MYLSLFVTYLLLHNSEALTVLTFSQVHFLFYLCGFLLQDFV